MRSNSAIMPSICATLAALLVDLEFLQTDKRLT